MLAAHGCRVSPRTGLRVAPSASMLDRLPELLDADEFEAALTAAVAASRWIPRSRPRMPRTARNSGVSRRKSGRSGSGSRRRRGAFREERADGWFRPHPQHPWLDPAACGDPGHVPARQGVAVDGKERKGAKAGGNKKVHLLAAVTHVPGIVIAQDKVAKAGKANEISHFKPLLAPLPLAGAVITSDAMQANRDNALFLRKVKDAHWLWPILGNQPSLNAELNALPWENTPVAAATSEISRGRIETRTIRVLPAPEGTGFEDAAPGPAHRALHHVQEQRAVAHPRRGRPLPHQPRPGRRRPRGPARPRPRPLGASRIAQQTAPMSSQRADQGSIIGREGLLRLVEVVERLRARECGRDVSSWTREGAAAPNPGAGDGSAVGGPAGGQSAGGGALARGDGGQGGACGESGIGSGSAGRCGR